MIQKNKIISKKLRPYALSLAIYCIGFGTLAGLGIATFHSDFYRQEHKVKYPIIGDTMWIAVLILITYVHGDNLLRAQKTADKFAARTAKKYVDQLASEHPELKQFQSVLCNHDFMKRVSTLISNELRPSERQEVLAILSRLDESDYREHSEKLDQAQQKIKVIIEEHAVVHPEFVDKIYTLVFNENYEMYKKQQQKLNDYVVKNRQNTRK